MVLVWLRSYRPEGRDKLFESFIKQVREVIATTPKEDKH